MQVDPLNSPYPLPWQWILSTQARVAGNQQSAVYHYRSSSVRSPDGQWLAYSRLRLAARPQLWQCSVSSILFVENLSHGSLHPITARSPLAQDFWQQAEAAPGAIALAQPIGWDRSGKRLLARQFEGYFCSSWATDYALIWDSHSHQAQTLQPLLPELEVAVVMGWSQQQPEDVIFEAGMSGHAKLRRWQVNALGECQPGDQDQPQVFGEASVDLFAGPQAQNG